MKTIVLGGGLYGFGSMILDCEIPEAQLSKFGAHAKHFYLSAPDLKPLTHNGDIDLILKSVEKFTFSKSIEMLFDSTQRVAGMSQLRNSLQKTLIKKTQNN